jgi:hypothetical protein
MEVLFLLDATHRFQRLKDEHVHTVSSTQGTKQHQARSKNFIPGGKSDAGKTRRSRAFVVILDALNIVRKAGRTAEMESSLTRDVKKRSKGI